MKLNKKMQHSTTPGFPLSGKNPQSNNRTGKLVILAATFGASLFLVGCGTSAGGGGTTRSVAGTTTPAGTPEYQALGKEACELINSARATMKTVSGSNSQAAGGQKTLTHSTLDMQGRNTRFIAPAVLATETHTHMVYQDKINPAIQGTTDLTTLIQVDLKNITGIAVIDNMMKNSVHKSTHAGVDVAGTTSGEFWKVMIGGAGVSLTDSNGNLIQYTASGKRDVVCVANFDNKAKAERLASILKKMSAIAKKQP